MVISSFILEELERNLKENLDWEEAALDRLRRKLKLLCGMANINPYLRLVKRKDSDNRILECAQAAKARVLITGDLQDLRPLNPFEGIEILTPREFLHKYFPNA